MHDDFELFEEIGRGPLGIVYRGHDLRADRPVAVKVIHRPLHQALVDLDAYWDSLRAAADLGATRRDMVRVHLVDADRGWVVSDLMPGPLPGNRRLPAEVVFGLLKQVLRPLGLLHTRCAQRHGAVHRRNLLIDADGFVLLADPRGESLHDATRALTPLIDATRRGGAGGVRTRPAAKYLAPELLDDGFGPVGAPADLYSLGVVAFALLAGPAALNALVPGAGPKSVNPDDAWARWQRDPAVGLPPVRTAVPGLPEAWAAVVDGLTAKMVDSRYGSAAEVLDDLRDLNVIVSIPAQGKGMTNRRLSSPAGPDPAPEPVPQASPHQVTPIGRLSPGRKRADPPKTLGQHLKDLWGRLAALYRRNRPIQYATAMFAVLVLTAMLFGGAKHGGFPGLFEVNVDGARLTLERIDPRTGSARDYLAGKPFDAARRVEKSLPAGLYRATVQARGYVTETRPGLVIGPGAANEAVFNLARRMRPVRLVGLEPRPDPARLVLRYGAREFRPDGLILPVEEKCAVEIRAEGYEDRRVSLTVPDDGDGPYEHTETIALTARPDAAREVVVEVRPIDAAAAISVDGRGRTGRVLKLAPGSYTLEVAAPGFRPERLPLVVPQGRTPHAVAVELRRERRPVRFDGDPRATIEVRRHGRPDEARVVRGGETREFEAGERLVVRATRAGLGRKEFDVLVAAGEGPQVVDVALPPIDRIKFSGVPFEMVAAPGGRFHLGFEPAVYDRWLREHFPRASWARPFVPDEAKKAVAPSDPFPPVTSTEEFFRAAASSFSPSRPLTATEEFFHALVQEMTFGRSAWQIKANAREFRKTFAGRPGENVFVPAFHVAQVPVTWDLWRSEMGHTGVPSEVLANMGRWGDHPAVGIHYALWLKFCRDITRRLQQSGEVGPGWELTPPTLAEVEYLVKGGLSWFDHEDSTLPEDERDRRLDESLRQWEVVQNNLKHHPRGRTQSVWMGQPNRLGVILGGVSTWTVDTHGDGQNWVAGPSHLSRPNGPRVFTWDARWPRPSHFGLPDRSAFLIHDLKGYHPGKRAAYPSSDSTPRHVGLYLVLRKARDQDGRASPGR